ncbi:hypothetical protein N7528_004930 [Penicillium herquei]|nr:hypothetical protein N7528_004930 [Penicillium herquei]
MARSSPSSNSSFDESTSSVYQGYQPEPHPEFTWTPDFDPTGSLTMTSSSMFSNCVDDQLADFNSLFSGSFPSYQVPGLDMTTRNDLTASNRPDGIQSINPAYCADDLSFTGSWTDMGTTAPPLPSTLFQTSNEKARGPEKEVQVEDKTVTQCSSCHKPKSE